MSASTTAPAATYLDEYVAADHTPALQYRFFSADSVLFRYDRGWADVARRTLVSRTTTYNGFSITKTFTAVAVLQLVEQGKLELDRPASDYLPGFPYGSAITVRHLLVHSSGLPNPIPLSWIHLPDEHDAFDSRRFFADLFAKHQTLKADLDERFGYSNLGYVLLGQMIEHVAGMSYEQYVTRHILQPLGLSSDDLSFTLHTTRQATGYHKRLSFSYAALGFFIDKDAYMDRVEGPWRPFRPYYVNGAAYGGLIGTADGFARYLQVLLAPQADLISEEHKRLLFTEHVLRGGRASGMGLSWFKGELDGHVYYAHAGGGGGYYTEVRIYPELERGSVVMLNRTGMSDTRFLDRVDRHLLPVHGELTGTFRVADDT